jgi:hypothetical protein
MNIAPGEEQTLHAFGADGEAARAFLFTTTEQKKRKGLERSTTPRTLQRSPTVDSDDSDQIAGCTNTFPNVRTVPAVHSDHVRAEDAPRRCISRRGADQ